MKRLIVNADDFGADVSRNAGILETIQAGVVTSLSVMANGPASSDFRRHIALFSRFNISIGIHMNLTEGTPLTPNLHRLTGPDGLFLGKGGAYVLFANPPDTALQDEIYGETTAQIEALLETGTHITHLDGHQHIHVFPAVIEIAVRAAEAYGIAWLRIPEEPWGIPSDGGHVQTEVKFYSELAAKARKRIRKSPVRTTDHFRGLSLKGRMSPDLLINTLANLPDGLTELMVHPGYAPSGAREKGFSAFSSRDRDIETEALLSAEFKNALNISGIALTPFPEGH